MSQTIAVTEEWPRKFKVKCDTCRVSQTYYTDVGVRYFKTIHSDHNVVEDSASRVSETPEVHAPRTIQEPVKHAYVTGQKNDHPFSVVRSEPVQAEKSPQTAESIPTQITSSMREGIRPRLAEGALLLPPKQEKSRRSEVSISHVSAKMEGVPTSLLLSKFSFLKEGESYRTEAIRVSNVLRTFRWKVQPPYVIGALFDDNLSIQSSTGVVSREVIMGIEQLGYYFVAVESPKGVMTAWFKKEGVQ